MSARPTLTFERLPDGRRFQVSGQTARTIAALVEAGDKGVTALECNAWAFRLAAYCYDLRRDFALGIETRRETHPGGWHGRHVLRTPVRIVTAEACDQQAADLTLPSNVQEGG